MYQDPDHHFHPATQSTDATHYPEIQSGPAFNAAPDPTNDPSFVEWLESIGVPVLADNGVQQQPSFRAFPEATAQEQQPAAISYPPPMLMPLTDVEPDVFRTKLAAATLARKRSKLVSASRAPVTDFTPSVDGVQALMVDITARFRHAAAVLSAMPNTSEMVAAKFALVLGAAEFAQDPHTLFQAYTESLPHIASAAPALVNSIHFDESFSPRQCQVPLHIEDAGEHIYDERAAAAFCTPLSPVRSLPPSEEVVQMSVDVPRAAPPRLVRPVARRASPIPVVAKRPLYEAFPLEEDADAVDNDPERSRCALEDLSAELWMMMLPRLGRAGVVALARTSRTMRNLMISLCDYKRTTIRIVPRRCPLGDYESLIMVRLAEWYPRADAVEVMLPTNMPVKAFWRPIRDLLRVMCASNPNLTVIITGSVLKGTDVPGLPQPIMGIKRLVINNEHSTDDSSVSSYGCIASLVNLDSLECLALRGRIPAGRPTRHYDHILSLGDHPLTTLKHVFILSDEAAVGPGVYHRPTTGRSSDVRNAPLALQTYGVMSETLRNSDVMVHLPELDRKWALSEHQDFQEPTMCLAAVEASCTENSRFVVTDFDSAQVFAENYFRVGHGLQVLDNERILFPATEREEGAFEFASTTVNPFTGGILASAKWSDLLPNEPEQ